MASHVETRRSVLALALCLSLAGCSTDCSTIGCQSLVTISIPDRLPSVWADVVTVQACALGTCAATTVNGLRGGTELEVALPQENAPNRVVVELTGLDSEGRQVTYTKAALSQRTQTHPNGPECPPTCDVLRAELGQDGQLYASL